MATGVRSRKPNLNDSMKQLYLLGLFVWLLNVADSHYIRIWWKVEFPKCFVAKA